MHIFTKKSSARKIIDWEKGISSTTFQVEYRLPNSELHFHFGHAHPDGELAGGGALVFADAASDAQVAQNVRQLYRNLGSIHRPEAGLFPMIFLFIGAHAEAAVALADLGDEVVIEEFIHIVIGLPAPFRAGERVVHILRP